MIQTTATFRRSFHLVVLISLFGLHLICVQPTFGQSESNVDYLTKIKPLLRDKCFSCHSSLKQEGGLRLDAASLIQKGGDSGPALVANAADKSLIIERITGDDDDRMPPADEGARLTAEEVADLTSWIKTGAITPKEAIPEHPSRHWAFLPPEKTVPPGNTAKWIRSDIDRFLAAEQKRIGAEAVGETTRSMLLRRASLTLTGLPPTPDQRRAFLNDHSESAFENAIDRLLQSPQYGERWARHFMDIWRYSDPSGYGNEIRDSREHIWRWRDWIVESINNDKSYDRMIVEMLAADEASPGDQSSLRATGYLARNWYKFNRNAWLDNIVEHSSKAFLGLTINCARCHDHKYDPFEQEGYYRMRAIFETHNVRDDSIILPSAPNSTSNSEKFVRVYDAHLDRPTYRFFLGNENSPDKDNPLPPGLPDLLGKLSVEEVSLPVTAWYPALQKQKREAALENARAKVTATELKIKTARSAVKTAEQKLSNYKAPKTEIAVSKDRENVPDGKSVLADDFSTLDLKRWRVENGKWSVKNGRLVQSNGATMQHRLVSNIEHPRDFRAKLRLRITGGETYKSVGIGFDGNELAMNSVYLSVSGPKVQFSSQGNDGKWQYPASGMATHSIKVGQDYLLEVAVKDQLLNVLIDGDLKVTYNLPKRKAGRLSVWAFSATAEFDQLDVTTLPAETKLVVEKSDSAVPEKAFTKKDLERALLVAKAAEKVAVAQRLNAQSIVSSLEARTNAELVKYGLAKGDSNGLAMAAGQKSRQQHLNQLGEQIAQAELKIASSRHQQHIGSKATRTKAASELQTAQKLLADLQKKFAAAQDQLDNGSAKYESLGVQYPKTSSGRRLAFSKWITSRKNPLAARVLVNHVWMRHFGTPLLEREFDFGLRSAKPRHAALLDWLAVTFMEDGWSMKKLHKRILMSGVFRLSSSSREASAATRSADPDNHTLWRMNSRRMEAEVVRDSLLWLGGELDSKMGGPPIDHTKGQTVLRRSIYFRQDKERQMTFLNLFDGAKVNECYQRKPTVAPQQALAMFNSPIASRQARNIAELYHASGDADFVNALFEHILSRAPNPKEVAECTTFLKEFNGSAEARRQLALVMLNHNDFVTIR